VKVHTCEHCGVRLILAKGAAGFRKPPPRIPPLNALPDPLGTVAAQHLVSGAWQGRFLAKGEEPAVPERRYSVHECDGTRHKAQRAEWQGAIAGLHKAQRNQRGKRAGPQITGAVVLPETLPGMDGADG
jgi:hypothetical protein